MTDEKKPNLALFSAFPHVICKVMHKLNHFLELYLDGWHKKHNNCSTNYTSSVKLCTN